MRYGDRSLLAAALLTSFAGAQSSGESTGPSLSSQLQQLARKDVDAETRDMLIGMILTRGPEAAGTLFDTVRAQYAERRKALTKELDRHLKTLPKAAASVLRKQQGKAGEAKIAELRDKARGITADPALSKERIHAEYDPLLAELQTLTTVSYDRLLEASPDLKKHDGELRQASIEILDWYGSYVRARSAASITPEGKKRVERAGPEEEIFDFDAVLARELECALLQSVCTQPRDEKVLVTNLELRSQIDAEEWRGVLELNRLRLMLGLPLLGIDLKLCTAARGHSDDMRKLNFFSHESPVAGKHGFGDRAALAGTSASAENIAAGQTTGKGAIEAWYYSPGHHKNMFGGHGRVGLGRSETLWTQMFGG